MASFDEILNNLHGSGISVTTTDAEESMPIEITPQRTFRVPSEYNTTLGYAGDVNSQIVTFKLPKTHEGHELSSCQKKKIKWKNLSSGLEDSNELTECNSYDDHWTATWEVPPEAMSQAGNLEVAISLYDIKDNKIAFSWNTASYKGFQIADSFIHVGQNLNGQNLPARDEILTVNVDTRQIVAPQGYKTTIANYGDIGVSKVYFAINKMVNGIDLSSSKTKIILKVSFPNTLAGDERDNITKQELLQNGQEYLICWNVPPSITSNVAYYVGNITISLEIVSMEGGTINKRWSSSSFSQLNIAPSQLMIDVVEFSARNEQIISEAVEVTISDSVDRYMEEYRGIPRIVDSKDDLDAFTTNEAIPVGTEIFVVSEQETYKKIEISSGDIVWRKTLTIGKNYTISEGYNTSVEGRYSHAEGYQTEAKGTASHTEGSGTKVVTSGTGTSEGAHAEGQGSIAGAQAAHAEGLNTYASGGYSHAEGARTFAIGQAAHVEGINSAKLSNDYVIATISTDDYNNPDELNNKLLSNRAIINLVNQEAPLRICNTASGSGSHAEGEGTWAQGTGSHAEGRETHARGSNSHAEGHGTCSGGTSHAEGTFIVLVDGKDGGGDANNESQIYLLPEGYEEKKNAEPKNGLVTFYRTEVTTGPSGQEGWKKWQLCGGTTSYGSGAHAEGQGTWAKGSSAHAEGYKTQAIADYAHAEGRETLASGVGAHASGIGTKAIAQAQTVIGKYNQENSNAIFIVGNGTADNARNNAFYINSDGILYGNGAGLTNLNADKLVSGAIPFNVIPFGIGENQVARGNHTHYYAGSSAIGGAANSVKEKLTIKVGTTSYEYNGSDGVSLEITPDKVGAISKNGGTISGDLAVKSLTINGVTLTKETLTKLLAFIDAIEG